MNELEKIMEVKQFILARTSLSGKELDQKVTDKIQELGGFCNDLAALHLLKRDLTDSDEPAPGYSEEDKLREKILKKVSKLDDKKLDGLLEELKGAPVFRGNNLLMLKYIANYFGVTLETTLADITPDTFPINKWHEASDDYKADAKGVVIRQRTKTKQGGIKYDIFETTISDGTGILKLKTYTGARKDGSFNPKPILEVGLPYVFYFVNRKNSVKEEFPAPTFWWNGDAHETDVITLHPSLNITDIGLAGYDSVILRGTITDMSELKSFKGYCVDCEIWYKSEHNNCSCGKEILGIKGQQFTLTDQTGSVSCSTEGFDILSTSHRNGGGIIDSLNFSEITVFGNYYDKHKRFMVHGLSKIKSLAELTSTFQSSLDNFMDKVTTELPGEDEKVPFEVITPTKEIEVVPESKLVYDEAKIIDWYYAQTQKNRAPIPVKTIIKELQEYGVDANQENVLKITKLLITEGLAIKYVGALLYPNI